MSNTLPSLMLTLCHLKRTDQPPNAASGLGVEPLVDGADRGHGVVTHRGFVERLGRPLAVLGTATRRSGSTSAGIVGAVNTHSDPEQFVTKFADFWNSPSPQGLPELLHPDVVLENVRAQTTTKSHTRQAGPSGPRTATSNPAPRRDTPTTSVDSRISGASPNRATYDARYRRTWSAVGNTSADRS
jgi:hypothetical protein